MYLEDTIAAVSTPAGEGGIGVIRISGPDSLSILKTIFKRKKNGGFLSHRFCYGDVIVPGSDNVIDEAFAVFMQAPNSFTREDVVEIQCHSGTVIMQHILEIILFQGARLAEPGEFTKRAFLNGRIDLAQAEAVIDLIRAKTDVAASLARQQISGVLSSELISVRNHLRHALALIEAFIDFPDEEIGVRDSDLLSNHILSALSITNALSATFVQGKVYREGVNVLIAGKPNVGKSSLLNTLLKEKRAIVTAVPGTTRDLIEEVVNIDGLPVKLLDTAGIRLTDDLVEQEGISRALERISSADLVLFILDASRPYDTDDLYVYNALIGKKLHIVFNKCDLPAAIKLPAELAAVPTTVISTLTSSGIDELRQAIYQSFLHGHCVDSRESAMLSRSRHYDILLRVAVSINKFIDHRSTSFPDELLALDLREALDYLGQITGETVPDDILELIFSQFCIGK